jgi:hypothetical protein
MVTNQSQRDAAAMFRLGARVDRATATLPQTAHAAIFTVTGGRVLIAQILGEATVIFQTQINNTKLTSYPTTGTAVDLCAVKDTSALEVGGKLIVPGVAATALTQSVAGAIIAETTPVIVAIGAIHLDCAASSTGSAKWSLWYVPVDDGALVVAA